MSECAIRAIQERDLRAAGDVNFLAFYRRALAHGLEPQVASPRESRRYLRHLLRVDPLGGLVAEEDGRVVGLAWLHARGPVATLGPLAVDPRAQGRGVGRRLLERAVEMAGAGVPQVRLVQDAFDDASLGLYLRAGFRVVAPLLHLERPAGVPPAAPSLPAGLVVRAAGGDDAGRVVDRDARAFGASRPQNVDLYMRHGRVLVAERATMFAGYALAIAFEGACYLGSASADDTAVLLALLTGLAAELAGPETRVRVLVPATDRRLVDGLLGLDFRVFRACHAMVRGGGTPPPPNYVLMNGDMM